MKHRSAGYLKYLTLVLYVAIIFGVNFFHTEKTLQESDTCPACNFAKSSICSSAVYILFLFLLYRIRRTELPAHILAREFIAAATVSRAPPSD